MKSSAIDISNGGASSAGPFTHLCVYGTVGALTELLWVEEIDPQVTLGAGDHLKYPDGLVFTLDPTD
jgi:hypothetical protein